MSGFVGVIGACNVDLIAYVPRLPNEGETLKGTSFEQGFGGKGANQAVQSQILGGSTIFISKLGGNYLNTNNYIYAKFIIFDKRIHMENNTERNFMNMGYQMNLYFLIQPKVLD